MPYRQNKKNPLNFVTERANKPIKQSLVAQQTNKQMKLLIRIYM